MSYHLPAERMPDEFHPLADLTGFRRLLTALQENAERRLLVERGKTRN